MFSSGLMGWRWRCCKHLGILCLVFFILYPGIRHKLLWFWSKYTYASNQHRRPKKYSYPKSPAPTAKFDCRLVPYLPIQVYMSCKFHRKSDVVVRASSGRASGERPASRRTPSNVENRDNTQYTLLPHPASDNTGLFALQNGGVV